MIPTVGRMVYFWGIDPATNEASECAALVVHVHDKEKVNLKVFSHEGIDFFHSEIPHSETKEFNSWDWMPYQKANTPEAIIEKIKNGLSKAGTSI